MTSCAANCPVNGSCACTRVAIATVMMRCAGFLPLFSKFQTPLSRRQGRAIWALPHSAPGLGRALFACKTCGRQHFSPSIPAITRPVRIAARRGTANLDPTELRKLVRRRTYGHLHAARRSCAAILRRVPREAYASSSTAFPGRSRKSSPPTRGCAPHPGFTACSTP